MKTSVEMREIAGEEHKCLVASEGEAVVVIPFFAVDGDDEAILTLLERRARAFLDEGNSLKQVILLSEPLLLNVSHE